jgi:putative Mg2+ transporter-C (MgtC) family protein
VTGVSFLGAGTIFFARQEQRVQGLTTAASLWTTAAVGISAGLGRYVLAAGVTIMLFLVLRGLGLVERRIESKHGTNQSGGPA